MAKLKDSYRIGYGHPYIYTNGLDHGIVFYSDTDVRFSNTRNTVWPTELNEIGRAKLPEYELVLRRVKRGNKQRRKAKERRKER